MNTFKKRCLIRITEADRSNLERFLFQRYPNKEWGTFFRFGFRRTRWGLAASFISEERPTPGDLDRNSPLVVFRSKYILRAHHIVEREPIAAGVIHSHPQGCHVFPSNLDDDMDGYFSAELSHYGKGKPYISLIFARDTNGQFHFTGRVYDQGECYPVTELLTVGDTLTREAAAKREATQQVSPSAGFDQQAGLDTTTARLETLLGTSAAKRLVNCRVGIVGCGGTGSPAAHVLARAGVGNFVLVDPQNFAPSNLERLHGSGWRDVKLDPPPSKVVIVQRLISEINSETAVHGFQGNVLDESVFDALLECDIVISCTDTNYSRAALADFAGHYLLPVLDVGVTMRAKEGALATQLIEICRFNPRLPCAHCLGKIDYPALSYELMSDPERQERKEAAKQAQAKGLDGSQYWSGEPHAEITVGYLTTLAGSMVAGYAMHLLTGSAKLPHQRFQFDVGWTKLGVVPDERSAEADCQCVRTIGCADQARADRSVSRPPHWPEENHYELSMR